MHESPSFASCISVHPVWIHTRRRKGNRKQLLVILILAILTAAAAGGITIWYYLHSWLTLPLP